MRELLPSSRSRSALSGRLALICAAQRRFGKLTLKPKRRHPFCHYNYPDGCQWNPNFPHRKRILQRARLFERPVDANRAGAPWFMTGRQGAHHQHRLPFPASIRSPECSLINECLFLLGTASPLHPFDAVSPGSSQVCTLRRKQPFGTAHRCCS